MDLGSALGIRPPNSPGEIQRPAAVPPPGQVKTDLPPAIAVPQAPGAARPEGRAAGSPPTPSPTDGLDREITLDLETRKIIYRAVDERTGDVIVQVPDPRFLKAYADQRRSAARDAAAPASLAVSA